MRSIKPGVTDGGLTQVDGINPLDVVANSSFDKLQDNAAVVVSKPAPAGTSGKGARRLGRTRRGRELCGGTGGSGALRADGPDAQLRLRLRTRDRGRGGAARRIAPSRRLCGLADRAAGRPDSECRLLVLAALAQRNLEALPRRLAAGRVVRLPDGRFLDGRGRPLRRQFGVPGRS